MTGTTIYLLAIRYLKSSTQMLFKEWDIDTVTVADYTIAMKISKEMFAEYLLKDDVQKYGDLYSYLTEFFEREVKRLP